MAVEREVGGIDPVANDGIDDNVALGSTSALAPDIVPASPAPNVVGRLGPSLCTYRALEFGGSYFDGLPLASRIPFANMGAELGAKVSIIETDAVVSGRADSDASYVARFEWDMTQLHPQVARPHAPHALSDIQALEGTPISLAFLGSCTNTRIEDLREAAAILKGRRVATGVRLYIVPATRQTFLEAIRDGTAETLTEAGATFLPSGCGPCVGTHLGVPGDGENVISAANRNFRGRMGNPLANIYLASPATVAASALKGSICNPQFYLE